MKIGIIGNMNNNAVNLARYLQDAGLDCTVLLYQNEASHFVPEADALSGVTYKFRTLSWGSYVNYFLTSPKVIRSDLADFDYIIGSRLAPAFLAKAGIPLDMFMPTGGDLHTLRLSSFMSAIFTSRWVFSITFAASATLILLALWVPAVMICL